MSKFSFLATFATTTLLASAALSAPSYSLTVYPRLSELSPSAIDTSVPLNLTVSSVDNASGVMMVQDNNGHKALFAPSSGSMFERSTAEVNSFLTEVETHRGEILQNYYAAVSVSMPLCTSCTSTGQTIQDFNRDILDVVYEFQAHQFIGIELAFDFSRYFDYQDDSAFIDQMMQLGYQETLNSMVEGRHVDYAGYNEHMVWVEGYHYDVVAGDPHSGERGVTANGKELRTLFQDDDLDNDGIKNEDDPDMDGDGIPNEDDWDQDGDGQTDWCCDNDDTDGPGPSKEESSEEECFPRPYPGFMNEPPHVRDTMHELSYLASDIARSAAANTLYRSYFAGTMTRAQVVANLNNMVAQQASQYATVLAFTKFH